MIDETLIGFDKNTANILILLDMSAAFDTVDLNKLLSILEHKIGLKGTALQWFRSFLLGRQQKVQIQGLTSQIIFTLYGVPQGSLLGPILFNIYVSSLSDVISSLKLSSSSYADDTNIRIKLSLQFQYHNICNRIPEVMKNVHSWMNKNFLKLNPEKTEIIFLYPPHLKKVPKLNGVFVNDNCIRFSNKVKLLGVHIDNELNFDHHVSTVVSSCMFHLKNISKIKRFLKTDELKKLVHAFMSSKLDYCNSLLYGINASSLSKLQAVQNRAARLVLGLPARATVTDNMLQDLHWLKVECRIIFKICLLVHKYFIDAAPAWLSRNLVLINTNERLLHDIYLNSKSGRRSFSYAAPRFWNRLPKATRLLNDAEKFKKSLKTVLFTNANDIIDAARGYLD